MSLAQVQGFSIYKRSFEHSVALGLGICARERRLVACILISSRREDSGESVRKAKKKAQYGEQWRDRAVLLYRGTTSLYIPSGRAMHLYHQCRVRLPQSCSRLYIQNLAVNAKPQAVS